MTTSYYSLKEHLDGFYSSSPQSDSLVMYNMETIQLNMLFNCRRKQEGSSLCAFQMMVLMSIWFGTHFSFFEQLASIILSSYFQCIVMWIITQLKHKAV